MKTMKGAFILALAVSALGVRAEETSVNGCRIAWTERTLTVGNGLFTRSYVSSNGVLRTTSFKAKDGTTWFGSVRETSGCDALKVGVRAAKGSPVGLEGARVTVSGGGQETVLDLYPSVPGVIATRPGVTAVRPVHDGTRAWKTLHDDNRQLLAAMAASDVISIRRRHVRATSILCHDQSDIRDQLVTADERLLMNCDWAYSLATTCLDLRDIVHDDGLVFVRLAPMPVSRPTPVDDFIVRGEGWHGVALLANGYPLVELAYTGGEAGRRRALVAFQRALRPYRPGRDGLLLSNTWGAGNADSRICEDFLLKEIEAGAKMGVDVIQIDDGWQRGRTQNSRKAVAAGQKKVWNGYWAADPDFWKEDRERFPQGLGFLVKKAAEKGMSFGLWFGPDSSDDAANWAKDADCLLDYHRRLGVNCFKMDSMKLSSPLALARNRKMFDRMLAESDGAMVFDLDCTAETRPGFFGLMDIGPLFLENRNTKYSDYWPHHTLKNLWDLSHVVDPVRLRAEFNNPDTNRRNYEWSPCGCECYWHPDAIFATVMAASPLAWMELSDVSEGSRAAIADLVGVWKAERARWHGGVIHPVGKRPDGMSWTGFVSEAADGKGGYALLFRELSGEGVHTLDLRPIFGSVKVSDVTVLSRRGTAKADGSRLTVSVHDPFDYVWVRFATASDVPPLMKASDGTEVTSVEQWEDVRRPEILRTMTEEVYGVRPVERPSDLAFKVLKEEDVFGGKAVKKLVRGTYSGPGGEGEMVFSAFLPKGRPAPAFVYLAPRPADTVTDPNGPRPGYLLPAEYITDRGYAVVAVCQYDSAQDWRQHPKAATNGVFKVFGPKEIDARKDCEWGILSAWAWGASRAMDWIETESAIDASRVGVVGLSRNGKTALVAGATDRRFALTVSCCSGMCGAKLNHFDCGGDEDAEAILDAHRWFSPRFRQWWGRDLEMPFDQHWMLSLIAPRLLFVSSATDDAWAGQRGEFMSCRLASPAWRLYGKSGLVEDGFPPPGQPLLEGSIGYHLRDGVHALTMDDWRAYLDFADRHGWGR